MCGLGANAFKHNLYVVEGVMPYTIVGLYGSNVAVDPHDIHSVPQSSLWQNSCLLQYSAKLDMNQIPGIGSNYS